MGEEKKLASPAELKGEKRKGSGNRGKPSFLLKGALLLAALGLAAGIYVLSGRAKPAEEVQPASSPAQDERVSLIDRPREEVVSVSIERGGSAAYTVIRESSEDGSPRYALKERADFDLDQSRADAILSCAAHLTATRRVAEDAEDLAGYGLEAPLSRVTMRYTDGTETVWLVGDKAPTSSAYYFLREGETAVYLLYASAAESLSAARNALHTLSLPAAPDAGLIRSLTVESPGADTVEFGYSEAGEADKQYSVSALRLRQPFYYTANAERALELIGQAAKIRLSSFAGALDELTDTGLENGQSRYRLSVTQAKTAEDLTDTETFVFRIGNRTEDGKSVYLSVDDSSAVYLTEASAVSFLEDATPARLVDQFTNLIRIGAVRSIDLQAGEERWLLEIDHAQEETDPDIYRINGQQITDASAFRKLYQGIIGLTSSKLSGDYHLDGGLLLSVRYELTAEPYELLVEYLDYDADYCAVRRDGLTLFLLKKEQLNGLLEALRNF